jgi:two-component system response regulator NreC
VARQVLHDYSRTAEPEKDQSPALTEREYEVLRLAVEGKSNKEIARLLVISHKTVSVHRTNIMAKLGVHNSAELVRYALQHHLVNVGNDLS